MSARDACTDVLERSSGESLPTRRLGGGLVSSRLFPYMHHLLIYIYDARRPRRVFGWGRNSAAAAGVK